MQISRNAATPWIAGEQMAKAGEQVAGWPKKGGSGNEERIGGEGNEP